MAKSVGMFQRPVEYKLNCLEMVYEFSGLLLEYYDARRRFVNDHYKYFMDYSGVANLRLCASYNNENLTIEVVPTYDVNSVHIVQYENSASSAEKIQQAKFVDINNYNNKVVFYKTMRDWIKEELIHNGFKEQIVNNAKILFDLRFYTKQKELFWLKEGSAVHGENFPYSPVATDEQGKTIWRSNLLDHDSILAIGAIMLSDASMMYYDNLLINEYGLTINDGNIGSVDNIIAYWDSLLDEF